jgi:hypothetical protein
VNDILARKIRTAIHSSAPLEQLWQVLHDFKEDGGEQADAYSTLENLRGEAGSEKEDLLLEAMDFVSGFYSPDARIWSPR